MPLYPCGEDGCGECERAFGPAQAAAVKRKNEAYRVLRAQAVDRAAIAKPTGEDA